MNLYERILKLVELLENNSQTQFAKKIDVPQATFNTYLNSNGQLKIKLSLLSKILNTFPQVNKYWLYFGEGEMFNGQQQEAPAHTTQEPPQIASVPILGFASCGVIGWTGKMTYQISASAPHATPGMVAVMATGESMIPAGIGHGHICYCDPYAEPLHGEVVYVRRKDDIGTLKTFLGWGEEAGVSDIIGNALVLKGWLDMDSEGRQKEIIISVHRDFIKTIAPVVYVRRRM